MAEGQPIPLFDEHRGVPAGDDSEVSSKDKPSTEESRLVQKIEKMLTDNRRHRSKEDQDWGENWKIYRGNQWSEKRPSYRHSEVLNYVYSEIQTALALLTDPQPNIEVIPEEPDDFEFSEILTQVLRSNWARNNSSYSLSEIVLDAFITGTGVGHVPWEKDDAQGQGDYRFESFDPMHFYPDPNCRGDVNDKKHCGHIISAVPTDIRKVKAMYPDKAHLVKPDLSDLDPGEDKSEINEFRIVSPTDKNLALQDSDAPMDEKPNRVLVITAYIRSDEMEIIKKEVEFDTGQKDEKGEPIKELKEQEFTKRKYPNGRKVVIANRRVMEDTELDNAENELFPFASFMNVINPRQHWGISEIEVLKSPQQAMNKIFSYMLDVLILMGNPIWVVDNDSGVDTDNIVNSPGLVVEKNRGTEVRREEGVQLQPFILQMFDRLSEGVFERLRTTSDVSQGVAPSANSSGFAIEQLTEAAQTKIRSKARNLDTFLKQVGKIQIDHILNSYSIPRIVRVTNNEAAKKYFKISVEKDPQGNRTAIVQKFRFDEAKKVFHPEDPKSMPIKGDLDIRISTGTTLPFAKAAKADRSRQLFLDGVFDGEDYVKALDLPNADKVIQKYNQRQEAAAQAAQAEAQAKAGGAPPQGA